MSLLVIRSARVLTLGGRPGVRRGAAMRDLGVIENADVYVRRGAILAVVPSGRTPDAREASEDQSIEEIDARGRVLMPGLIDCHTHMCWGGGAASRIDEWERMLAGDSYQQIAQAGGGIMASVRATRAASPGELACDLLGRADRALAHGSTTIEIKTGYGLDAETELKMLEAIGVAGGYFAGTLVPTALLGHAIDPDYRDRPDDYVSMVTEELLPRIAPKLVEACRSIGAGANADAFCESSSWSPAQCSRLFTRARGFGLGVRVHADQFTALGMVEAAAAMPAVSVDHLEASGDAQIAALAASPTIGVVLPCCGLHLDGRYAPARRFVDAGAAIAIATNMNPGSAPTPSLPLAMALGVRFGKLTPAEAIVAATVNAAGVLGFTDRGFIGPGARADLLLLEEPDERTLVYELGASPVATTIVAGRLIES